MREAAPGRRGRRALRRHVEPSGACAVGNLAQDRLVELVSLRRAAVAPEDGFPGDELVRAGEHADGGLAAAQLGAEPLAVRVVEPDVLVVQLAEQGAAGGPDADAHGPEDAQDEA